MASGGGEVDEEITLPGLVGQDGSRGSLGFTPKVQLDVGKVASKAALEEDVVASDDEELEDVVETLSERLMGLTEMLPDPFWHLLKRTRVFSWWLTRRSAWVVGSSAIVLFLPIFIQQQRLDMEEMQNMQRKQMLLGPSSTSPIRL